MTSKISQAELRKRFKAAFKESGMTVGDAAAEIGIDPRNVRCYLSPLDDRHLSKAVVLAMECLARH